MHIEKYKAIAQRLSNTIYRICRISLVILGLSEENFYISIEIFKEILNIMHLSFHSSSFISNDFWVFHVQWLLIVITPKRKGSLKLPKV